MCSLEMSKLCALLSPASRVKSRRAVLSMTHRLTLPYSLDDGAMSILGEHFLADGRMDDGGRFISSPLHSGENPINRALGRHRFYPLLCERLLDGSGPTVFAMLGQRLA
jgi:hypothetical protein